MVFYCPWTKLNIWTCLTNPSCSCFHETFPSYFFPLSPSCWIRWLAHVDIPEKNLECINQCCIKYQCCLRKYLTSNFMLCSILNVWARTFFFGKKIFLKYLTWTQLGGGGFLIWLRLSLFLWIQGPDTRKYWYINFNSLDNDLWGSWTMN